MTIPRLKIPFTRSFKKSSESQSGVPKNSIPPSNNIDNNAFSNDSPNFNYDNDNYYVVVYASAKGSESPRLEKQPMNNTYYLGEQEFQVSKQSIGRSAFAGHELVETFRNIKDLLKYSNINAFLQVFLWK